MSSSPRVPEIAEQACRRLTEVLKENLASCVLYGSAVRGDMVPGRSDVNLLIVLNHSTPEAHQAIAHELRGFKPIAPFVLSKWELPRSRRVFAVKFRSIQRHYMVLHGEDPLAGFSPSAELLIFLSEQSLRNLRLRLKHAFIRSGHDPSRYERFVLRCAPSLFVALSEMLRCAGVDVPSDYRERPDVLGKELGMDVSVLAEIRGLKRRPRRLSVDDVFDIHARLFRLLSNSLDWLRERWPQTTETM